jgi:thiamine-phosphate pyrophosphorylase
MKIPAFYPILDTAAAAKHGIDPLDAARQILDAGARILQFRHKGFFSRETVSLLFAIAELTRDAGALLVVNDRADLARLAGAALHLGQDDLPPEAARRIVGPDARIGFSTHNEAQLRAAEAEPVDYLAIGPMFGTTSKENPDPVAGVEELRRLRPLTARPLVAIGGITRENVRDVIRSGADSVAVIGDLFPADGRIRRRAEEWLRLLS